MINIISGTTAITSMANNSLQKRDNMNQNKQNMATSSQLSKNSLLNSLDTDTFLFSTDLQEQTVTNNTETVDYHKEALSMLINDLRKEYIERNHYIDEDTHISVLQIVNTETDDIIGQYPSDLYLNLISRVKEEQKQIINEKI